MSDTTAPNIGDRATCRACGKVIEYVGPYWRHVGLPPGHQPRHVCQPVTPPPCHASVTPPPGFAPAGVTMEPPMPDAVAATAELGGSVPAPPFRPCSGSGVAACPTPEHCTAQGWCQRAPTTGQPYHAPEPGPGFACVAVTPARTEADVRLDVIREQVNRILWQHRTNLARWEDGTLTPTEPDDVECETVKRELRACIATLEGVMLLMGDGEGATP